MCFIRAVHCIRQIQAKSFTKKSHHDWWLFFCSIGENSSNIPYYKFSFSMVFINFKALLLSMRKSDHNRSHWTWNLFLHDSFYCAYLRLQRHTLPWHKTLNVLTAGQPTSPERSFLTVLRLHLQDMVTFLFSGWTVTHCVGIAWAPFSIPWQNQPPPDFQQAISTAAPKSIR